MTRGKALELGLAIQCAGDFLHSGSVGTHVNRFRASFVHGLSTVSRKGCADFGYDFIECLGCSVCIPGIRKIDPPAILRCAVSKANDFQPGARKMQQRGTARCRVLPGQRGRDEAGRAQVNLCGFDSGVPKRLNVALNHVLVRDSTFALPSGSFATIDCEITNSFRG